MNWSAPRPRIEIAAEWLAAACLGGAVGFALHRVALVAPLVAVAIGCVAMGAAWFGLSLVDRSPSAGTAGFAPLALPEGVAAPNAVMLLEERVEHEVLLLDQPLAAVEPAPADTSRVVRLFGDASPHHQESGAIPAPGEMLAQIEDFLGVARGHAAAPEPDARAHAASADASAALHAALADIRRSLRQG